MRGNLDNPQAVEDRMAEESILAFRKAIYPMVDSMKAVSKGANEGWDSIDGYLMQEAEKVFNREGRMVPLDARKNLVAELRNEAQKTEKGYTESQNGFLKALAKVVENSLASEK